MENIYTLAKQSRLFEGFDEKTFWELYACLRCRVTHYRRGEVLRHQGDAVRDASVVLYGEAQPASESISGAHSAAARLKPGNVFGYILMSAEHAASPVRITAASDLAVLHIPFADIMRGCGKNCEWHVQLRLNLLHVISETFLLQNRQLQYLKCNSLRERILLFLADARREAGTNPFTIDYDRETLAAYLHVNRSALSRELGRMRDEGVLTYYKNSFKLLYTKDYGEREAFQ